MITLDFVGSSSEKSNESLFFDRFEVLLGFVELRVEALEVAEGISLINLMIGPLLD